jgi:hypothetical protein
MKEATATEPERAQFLVPNVRFSNPGRVRVSYIVREISFVLLGKNYPLQSGDHMNVIHPGEETVYFFPSIPIDFVIQPGMTAELGFKVEFWRVPADRETLAATVIIETQKVEGKLTLSYLYKLGPVYEKLPQTST